MRVTLIALMIWAGCDQAPRMESDPPHIASPPEAPRPDDGKPPVETGPTGSWTLMGPVTASQACPVFVALTSACGDWSTAIHEQAVASGLYLFDVPDGTYHLSAFADCNGNTIEDAGDLRYHNATEDKPCRSYVLKGRGTVSLPIALE